MLYKDYGSTGKKTSVIGFGGMRFLKNGIDYDIDSCAQLVRKANELGINYFDTAPGYCEDKSEIIFGEAFKNMPKEFYVSTKSMKKNGIELRQQLETSLKRLGVNKINFFHIWCVLSIEDYKNRMAAGGAYEAALKAKEEGLIDHIVISTHCNGDEIEEIAKEGKFEGITLGYNILNSPYRQKGIKAAFQQEMGVATMNPLGGGLIPQNSDYFSFLKSDNDSSVVESALKFNGAHKEITTVLPGISTMEELIQNVKVGDKIEELSQSKLDEIQSKLFSSMNELCTGCRYCEYCPKNIEISKLMIAYNQNIIKNQEEGENWLKYHWRISNDQAKSCIECGICEGKCTQHLPIIKRLKEISNWNLG